MQETSRSTSTTTTNESAKPFRGRRMSWWEFYALRPDLRPANDNERTPKSARLTLPRFQASGDARNR